MGTGRAPSGRGRVVGAGAAPPGADRAPSSAGSPGRGRVVGAAWVPPGAAGCPPGRGTSAGRVPPGRGTSAGRTGSGRIPGASGATSWSARSARAAPASAGSGAAASAPKTSAAGRGATAPQRARRLARAAARSAWWSIGRPILEHLFYIWKRVYCPLAGCRGTDGRDFAPEFMQDRAPHHLRSSSKAPISCSRGAKWSAVDTGIVRGRREAGHGPAGGASPTPGRSGRRWPPRTPGPAIGAGAVARRRAGRPPRPRSPGRTSW